MTIKISCYYKNTGVKEYWIIDPISDKVIVYLFSKSNVIEFYNFDDVITVELYKNNKENLTICINELI